MALRAGAHGRTWPSVALVVLDVVGLVGCLNAALRYKVNEWVTLSYGPLLGAVVILVMSFYVMNLYAIGEAGPRWRIAARTALAIFAAGVITVGVVYSAGASRLEAEPLFWRSVYPIGMLGFALWAVACRVAVERLARSKERRRRWLAVGGGERLAQFVEDFSASRLEGTLHLLSSDETLCDAGVDSRRVQRLGGLKDLETVLEKPWTEVVISAVPALPETVLEPLMHARLRGAVVLDVVDFYEYYFLRVPIFHVADGWFVHTEGFQLIHHDIALNLKRFIDLVLAVAILLAAAPVMLAAALAVKIDSNGPVLYRQRRVGQGGRAIVISKFRTMFTDAETEGAKWASRNDPRVTRVGRWLRLTRIDELPQLWNVLRGEMSCIGPRPERPEFTQQLEKSIPYYELRHLVPPGITGWAQVMHPYGASEDDARRKLEYDLYYIKNYSLVLDLMIALKTIRVVLFGRGQ